MFTGIVQTVGHVQTIRHKGSSSSLRIALGELSEEIAQGDSVMVNGTCLTATDLTNAEWEFDVSSETLKRTTLGNLRRGEGVNIELAMRPTDRFGGHFVSGHVDGIGRIVSLREKPGETRLKVEVDPALSRQMIMKGSVALDGISLTVAALSGNSFEVSLIPHTMEATTLPDKKQGDEVNIECDMIGKWVKKLTEEQSSSDNDLLDKLGDNEY